jgi:hypothetical protein
MLKILGNESNLTIINYQQFSSDREVQKYELQFSICEFKGSIIFYVYREEFIDFIKNLKKLIKREVDQVSFINFEEIYSIDIISDQFGKIKISGKIKSDINNNCFINYNLETTIDCLILESI